MPPALLSQIETALRLTDHAAQQDMKWWFLGLLVTGGCFLLIVARYWSKQHERLSKRLDEVQDERTEDLKMDKEKLLTVVSNNSEAFKQFSHLVGSIQHHFEPAADRRR